ncbi:MAG TPA: class I SAM-dependent methyltransferase [archaeon]|nr:class I SAM-dependent methyltransferase [archaeon]
MRREITKKYMDKYSLGVVDIENSLALYNSFYKNMGFSGTIQDLIEKKLEEKVFVSVMDIGCGNGGFLSELKKEFDEQVHTIGVDLLAPEKQPDKVIIGDALEVEYPKEVDFIFSFRSLHEVGESAKMVKKIYNSLANGGKAFLSFRTMDMYVGSIGIAEIGQKDISELEKMVRARKFENFMVGGFEVSVKDEKGKKHTAGINLFLEK